MATKYKKNVQREVKTDKILIISIKELCCHRIFRRFQIQPDVPYQQRIDSVDLEKSTFVTFTNLKSVDGNCAMLYSAAC